MLEAREKISKCINSSKTLIHLEACRRLIIQFEKQYGESNLWYQFAHKQIDLQLNK